MRRSNGHHLAAVTKGAATKGCDQRHSHQRLWPKAPKAVTKGTKGCDQRHQRLWPKAQPPKASSCCDQRHSHQRLLAAVTKGTAIMPEGTKHPHPGITLKTSVTEPAMLPW